MHTNAAERSQSPGLYKSGRRDTGMDRYLLQREVEFIDRYLKGTTRPGRLLDLCCGSGEISLALDKLGMQLLALDVNRLALAAFRDRAQKVSLVQGDALRLPFSNSSLGIIVAIHCFDHVDRIGFLQECSRVLRNSGLLVFDSLNRHSYKLAVKRLSRRTGARSRPDFLDKYVNVFSWREVLQAIAGAGFDVQAVSGYGWIPFTVNSRSRLVNAAARVEQVLQLDRLPHVSPRVMMAVRKKTRY